MAQFANSSVFTFTGRLGNVVGFNMYGIPRLRRCPQKTTKEPTPAKLAHQARFKLALSVINPLSPLIAATFPKHRKKSNLNLACSHIFSSVITGSYPDYQIDWSKLLISKGQLAPTPATMITNVAGRIVFLWTPYNYFNSKPTDKIVLAVYAPALKQCVFTIGAATRSEGIAEIDASCFAGEEVHTYLGLISADGQKTANSIYTGKIKLTKPKN